MQTHNDSQAENIIIAEARVKHVDAISNLTQGINLRFRSPIEVHSLLSNFLVAIDGKNDVVGCVGSKLYDLDMEIISLRVKDEFLFKGLGKKLLTQKLFELKMWPKINIFSLTTEALAQRLYYPLGFTKVGIQLFGPKILTDCLECHKNKMEGGKHLCDELAVLYQG